MTPSRFELSVALLATLLVLVGCAAETASENDAEPGAGQTSAALTSDNGGDPFQRYSSVIDADDVAAAAVDDPAVCFSFNGYVVFQRDSSNQFKSVTWDSGGSNDDNRSSKWTTWSPSEDTSRTFNSKPACANLDTADGVMGGTAKEYKLLLAGRGSDNKLYASAAQGNTSGDGSASTPPSVLSKKWTRLDEDKAFASAPAAAAGGGKIVVVGLSDNRFYAYVRALPYSGSSWGTAIKAGALPSGWTPQGNPAIAYVLGGINRFMVVTRATDGSVTRFFRAYFDGSSWVKFATSPNDLWAQLPMDVAISGDPALAFSTDVNALTLYFRYGAWIVQTTGLDFGLGTTRKIRSSDSPTFSSGGPAGVGMYKDRNGEMAHVVVGRVSNGGLRAAYVPTPLSR